MPENRGTLGTTIGREGERVMQVSGGKNLAQTKQHGILKIGKERAPDCATEEHYHSPGRVKKKKASPRKARNRQARRLKSSPWLTPSEKKGRTHDFEVDAPGVGKGPARLKRA